MDGLQQLHVPINIYWYSLPRSNEKNANQKTSKSLLHSFQEMTSSSTTTSNTSVSDAFALDQSASTCTPMSAVSTAVSTPIVLLP